MNRDRYESLEYDGRLYDEMRRIEREKEDLQRKLKEKDKEITRLNNIIGNIEKHLLNYLEEWEECKKDDEFVKGRCLMARDVLHDIHELKEGK